MSVSARLYKTSNRLPKYRPLGWREYFKNVVAHDVVLWIALGLALVSSLVVRPPLAVYMDAIDWRTLACLTSLMAASGGFMISGVFDVAAARLVNRCRTVRSLMAALLFTTFFASMFITNDVALIVFVPMTLIAFRRAGIDPALTVILQTIAANVGSILLPMGNPQNLFLYSRYSMTFGPFLQAVWPLSLAGGIALGMFCMRAGSAAITCPHEREPYVKRTDALLYASVFIIAALGIFGWLDYRIAFAIACVVMAVRGKNLIQQVDYGLLLTFIGFFIFVGNMARIPEVGSFLGTLVGPRPYLAAVVSSQIISNVPAAVMLSNFTDNAQALLAGVSAGGCGTLIASMASLISYKLYIRSNGAKKRYIFLFTMLNLLFLAIMTVAHFAAGGTW